MKADVLPDAEHVEIQSEPETTLQRARSMPRAGDRQQCACQERLQKCHATRRNKDCGKNAACAVKYG
jgi:hypothetical protein